MTGIRINKKTMEEILEFACNDEEINPVFLDVPENRQVQNAIVKAVDGCRRTTFNLNFASRIAYNK